MGKKIRPRGASIATAYQNETAPEPAELDFRKRVFDLCSGYLFNEKTLGDLYSTIGAVNGKWLSEWGQPEVLPIARRLACSAKFLENLARELAGIQSGMRQSEDMEFALLARQALSLNPLVRNLLRADEKLRSFQQQCSEIAEAFWVACKTLKEERGKTGRKELNWYDDFTELLLEIAKLANTEPKLNKDRGSGARGGWLFEAAQALEYFLYPPMRSASAEACGKRLERSLKRLKRRHRQIGS